MKLSFRNAFQQSKLITVHAQVKSGKSYRLESSNATTLVLAIDKGTLNALSGTATPGVVVWVPPVPLDRLYWYASDPRRPLKTPARISRRQFVRPSIRYDLTRLSTYSAWTRSFSRQTMAEIDAAAVIARARQAYAALKETAWHHPLVGPLAVTRLAWRHVTRRSKTTVRRVQALRVVPYLKAFLSEAPDRYVCNQAAVSVCGCETREVRHILCWYRGALSINGDSYSLLLRIREEVSYPTKWQSRPLSTADIRQTATLASWWCKKEK